jgi:ribonucleotide monophosphatase NagD (HAD superfamily)
MNNTKILESFSEIIDNYDIIIFDVWGCLMNGI